MLHVGVTGFTSLVGSGALLSGGNTISGVSFDNGNVHVPGMCSISSCHSVGAGNVTIGSSNTNVAEQLQQLQGTLREVLLAEVTYVKQGWLRQCQLQSPRRVIR